MRIPVAMQELEQLVECKVCRQVDFEDICFGQSNLWLQQRRQITWQSKPQLIYSLAVFKH